MSEYSAVCSATLPVFLVIFVGAWMRRARWLSLDADQSLMRMTINVLVPCLSFESILGNRAFEHWNSLLLLAPGMGIASILLGYAICAACAPFIQSASPAERRTFSFTTGTYNFGYIPIPLCIALFDRETTGVLFLHNVGVDAAIWTAGLIVLTGASARDGWKNALSPPLFAIVLALTLNFLHLRQYLPDFLMGAIHMLGQCAIPASLLLIGATILDYAGETRPTRRKRVSLLACLLRLLILPLLFLAAARWLPLPIELKRVIVLQAAMPAAIFPIVMTKHYGGDISTALRVVLVTSFMGLITIPLWLRFGLAWIAP